MSAVMYYGYTNRVAGVWHIAVDNRSAQNKYKLDFPVIKAHFIDESRLYIGVSTGKIDGIDVKICARERVICDCLRHMNTMDGEIFNTAIQRYVHDKKKNAAKLMKFVIFFITQRYLREIIMQQSTESNELLNLFRFKSEEQMQEINRKVAPFF